jgi:small conductance mechanosensitive channel
MKVEEIQAFLSTTVVDVAIKIAAAIAFWIIGRWLIGRVIALIQGGMNRSHIDPTLTKYLGSIVAVMLNVVLVLGILGYFGIETTSFAALLAGAGLAIGAAWSGLLGNFAAGAFMLVLRPMKVGDFVCVGGVTGTVHELGLFGTTIITPDNVLTTVGNGKVFGDTIQNFSSLPVRRVDRTAQLAGSVDPLEAIERFRLAVANIPNVSKDRAPEVNLLDMNLNGPVIAVRPYTSNGHLLAGVLRHQRSDRSNLQGSGLASPDADPNHARAAELTSGTFQRVVRPSCRRSGTRSVR